MVAGLNFIFWLEVCVFVGKMFALGWGSSQNGCSLLKNESLSWGKKVCTKRTDLFPQTYFSTWHLYCYHMDISCNTSSDLDLLFTEPRRRVHSIHVTVVCRFSVVWEHRSQGWLVLMCHFLDGDWKCLDSPQGLLSLLFGSRVAQSGWVDWPSLGQLHALKIFKNHRWVSVWAVPMSATVTCSLWCQCTMPNATMRILNRQVDCPVLVWEGASVLYREILVRALKWDVRVSHYRSAMKFGKNSGQFYSENGPVLFPGTCSWRHHIPGRESGSLTYCELTAVSWNRMLTLCGWRQGRSVAHVYGLRR